MKKLKHIKAFCARYAIPLVALVMYLFVATSLVLDVLLNKDSVALAGFTALYSVGGLFVLYHMFATAFRINHRNNSNSNESK